MQLGVDWVLEALYQVACPPTRVFHKNIFSNNNNKYNLQRINANSGNARIEKAPVNETPPLKFDHFDIVDFHSALTFLDRDLAKF